MVEDAAVEIPESVEISTLAVIGKFLDQKYENTRAMSRIEFRRPAKETRAAYLRVGIVTSCRYGDAAGSRLETNAMLKGKRTAAYPALEPDIKAAGVEFVDSEAVVDVMVSARAWPDHPSWMREFIWILKQKSLA